jgi:O-antigen ligase
MNIKRHLIRTGLIWASLLVFMGVSRPDNLPVIMLILPFVLLFVALLSSWNLFLALYVRYGLRGGQSLAGRKRLGVTISISLVLLLVLQSLGQLTLKDAATVGALALIGYLYIGRGLFEPKKP